MRKKTGETTNVTIRDVAKAAGVSLSTVSRVLNAQPSSMISEETKQKVQEAIAQLNYVPNTAARKLGAGQYSNRKGSDLSGQYLVNETFVGADFRNANLRETNLSGADLSGANLSGADLSGANLSRANLKEANFNGASLKHANLSDSYCGSTIFVSLDLSTTRGLDTIKHEYPSVIGVDTLYLSKGKIPEIFLRGCGVPETLITFLPSMLDEAIQFYSCFISYSHQDKEFAKRLYDHLQGKGIRCWLDEHQLRPGDELHKTIYEAIRIYDKVIICCSESSLKSWWLEKELSNAINKEEINQKSGLIPITLDSYLFDTKDTNYVSNMLAQRNAVDFSNWRNEKSFKNSVEKTLKALQVK